MTAHIGELLGWLDKHDWPQVSCPVCGKGALKIASTHHQLDRQSAEVVARANRGAGPADELAGTFVGTLQCDRKTCLAEVAMAGDWQLVVNEGDPALGEFGEIFAIRYLNPSPQIVEVPPDTPPKLVEAIAGASAVFWMDSSASANRLRHAVEVLMDSMRVRKTVINKSHNRTRLTLHARIEEFARTRPDVASALMAVKWIGNHGTHDNDLTPEDVIVGASILELAIKNIYDKRDAELMKKVRAINRARGLSR